MSWALTPNLSELTSHWSEGFPPWTIRVPYSNIAGWATLLRQPTGWMCLTIRDSRNTDLDHLYPFVISPSEFLIGKLTSSGGICTWRRFSLDKVWVKVPKDRRHLKTSKQNSLKRLINAVTATWRLSWSGVPVRHGDAHDGGMAITCSRCDEGFTATSDSDSVNWLYKICVVSTVSTDDNWG